MHEKLCDFARKMFCSVNGELEFHFFGLFDNQNLFFQLKISSFCNIGFWKHETIPRQDDAESGTAETCETEDTSQKRQGLRLMTLSVCVCVCVCVCFSVLSFPFLHANFLSSSLRNWKFLTVKVETSDGPPKHYQTNKARDCSGTGTCWEEWEALHIHGFSENHEVRLCLPASDTCGLHVHSTAQRRCISPLHMFLLAKLIVDEEMNLYWHKFACICAIFH